MCGRFTLLDLSDFIALFPWVVPPEKFAPRYNIAPSQPVLMLTGEKGGRLDHALWGLIPPWANPNEPAKSLINARCETVAQKPAFRNSLRYKRCIVPANGFYEWARPSRQPHYITLGGSKPMLMAGLYENSHDNAGGEFRTVCIITTAANEFIAPLHDRMPAILSPDDARTWLMTPESEANSLVPLLKPFPGEMQKTPVDRRVNSPSHEGRDCIEPMTADEDRGLFGAML